MALDRYLHVLRLIWLLSITCHDVSGLSVAVSPSPTAKVVSGETLTITCQWSADYTGQLASVNYRLNDGEGSLGTLLMNFGTTCPEPTATGPSYTFSCNRDTRTLGIQIPANSYSHGDRWTCEGKNNTSDSTTQTDTTTMDVVVPVTSVNISPSNTVTVDVETSTTLTCVTQPHSRPSANVTWYRMVSGQPQMINANISVSHDNQDSLRSTTSVLSYVPSKEDNGRTLYCETDGGLTGSTASYLKSDEISLNVRYPPDGSPTVSGYDGSTKYKDDSVTLSCIVAGGNPAANLSWVCPDGTTVGGTVSVVLSNLFHGRSCKCTATHITGGYSRTVATPAFIVNVPVTSVNISPSTTVTVDVGTSTTLTCVTQPHSRPTANVTWYRMVSGQPQMINANISVSHDNQDSLRSTTSVLPYVPSNTDNGRTVYCISDGGWTGSTSTTLQSGSVTLDVRYPPTNPLTVTGKTDPVYDGDNIDLQCKIKGGNPLASLSWMCPGQSVTTTPNYTSDTAVSVLRIGLTPGFNGANCTCTATHPVQGFTTSHTEVFNVYYAPQFRALTETDPFPWLARKDYVGRLTCNTTVGNPSATRYTWYRDGLVVSSLTSQVIMFGPPVSSDDGLVYKCRAENAFTDVRGSAPQSNITLDVEFAPVITSDCPVKVNETDNYQCTCTAVGKPTPVVTWLPQSLQQQNVLNFSSINRDKAGLYTCNATSSSSKFGTLQTQSVLNLVVQYAPDVTLLVQNSTEGVRSLVMTCNASGIPNSYTFSNWVHRYDNTLIRTLTGDMTTQGRTLTLDRVSYQDIGTYTCQVHNSITGRNGQLSQTGTAVFDVKGVPRLLENEARFVTEKNQHLNITMTFISHPAPIDMFVSKIKRLNSSDDLNITFSEDMLEDNFYGKSAQRNGYRVDLNFPSFQISQEGDYTLTVINNVNQNLMYIFNIIIIDVPDQPKDIQVTRVTTQSALVSWTGGFNRGRQNQTFNLWIKEVNTDAWIKYNMSQDITSKEILQLRSASTYKLLLFAENEKGRSENLTREFKTLSDEETSIAPLIGGVAGGVSALLIIVILGIFLYRRNISVKSKHGGSRSDTSPLGANDANDNDDGQDGLKMNILYESAGPYRPEAQDENNHPENAYAVVNKKTQGAAVYAEVQKKPHGKAVYAEVVPKKDRNTADGKDEESKDVYAEVKKIGKPKKQERKEKKKGKGKKTRKSNTTYDEDRNVYENVSEVDGKTAEVNANSDNAVPTIPPKPSKKSTNGRRKNKDGLIYLDLEFKDKQDGTRQAVIHGIENRNNYAIVDFTKRADPLPDDDDDDDATEDNKKEKGNKE